MKADLHIHTSYSHDSASPPKEMVKAALSKGINCIAITDHNEIKGAVEAIEFASDKPILIIPGIEIKSRKGDILGLGIKKLIPKGLSARETIKEIKRSGGIAIIPHPFAFNNNFKGNLKNLMDYIDGIEVLNASVFGKGNQKAFEFAQKYNLPFIAASDAHSPKFVGRAHLEIPGNNLSIEEIFKEIKNRNVKIGGGEASFFEKAIDHSMRNIIKMEYYTSKLLKIEI